MNQEQIAVVRAIPMPGFKRRWCGLERWVENKAKRPNPEEKHGLPWPDHEIKVRVVDNPAPFDPDKNGGVPVEISPATFAMLERDDRISAKLLGVGEGDPAENVRVKAQVAKLEEELANARRESSELIERLKLSESASQKMLEAAGAKLASVEAQLEHVRSQMGARKK